VIVGSFNFGVKFCIVFEELSLCGDGVVENDLWVIAKGGTTFRVAPLSIVTTIGIGSIYLLL
jgi:hypothetical protein